MQNLTMKEMLERTSFLAPLESQKEYRLQMVTFIRLHQARVKAIEDGVEPLYGYLKDNVNPDEMTLMSLEMLAGTTEKDPLNASTFDVLIGRAIKATEEANKASEEEEEEREICEIEKRYTILYLLQGRISRIFDRCRPGNPPELV